MLANTMFKITGKSHVYNSVTKPHKQKHNRLPPSAGPDQSLLPKTKINCTSKLIMLSKLIPNLAHLFLIWTADGNKPGLTKAGEDVAAESAKTLTDLLPSKEEPAQQSVVVIASIDEIHPLT
jgi:hypothetical protein